MCGGFLVECGGYNFRREESLKNKRREQPIIIKPNPKKNERLKELQLDYLVPPKIMSAKEILKSNPVVRVSECGLKLNRLAKNLICIGYSPNYEIVQLLDIDNHANLIYYTSIEEIQKLKKMDENKLYGIFVNSDLEVKLKVKESINALECLCSDKTLDFDEIEKNLKNAKEILKEQEQDLEY